ncbi:MAG: hypothetical protein ABI867_03355, partial [Kofleriaceae bacterium]
ALMEKVRKAEVPPPSNFNRRVTSELDAISLKALSRDVADRYQTAAQLAADLDALLGSYRFDPKELRQFMRQLFRKEYAKENEDIELSLDSEPGASQSMSSSQPRPATATGVGTPTETVPRNTIQGMGKPPVQPPNRPSDTENSQSTNEVEPDTSKPRGFWGSLFKKRK